VQALGQGEAFDPDQDGRAQQAQRRHRWLGLLQAAGPECFHWQSAATGWLWLLAPTSGDHLPGQGGLLDAGELAGKVSCGHRSMSFLCHCPISWWAPRATRDT
jgi:hypothetical protein